MALPNKPKMQPARAPMAKPAAPRMPAPARPAPSRPSIASGKSRGTNYGTPAPSRGAALTGQTSSYNAAKRGMTPTTKVK